MIVRPQQHWLRRIFVWHGSVLSKISSRLLLNFLFSIAVIFMLPWYTHLGIKFTLAPFSILGVAIAIFLGFRNNAGYARYVEARKLWGQLMIASRSLLREVKTTLPDSASVREQLACECMRQALHNAGIAPEYIAAVSACSMREGIVLYNNEGAPIWACANVDARAAREVSELKELHNNTFENEVYRATGQTLALSAIPRLLWLAHHRSDIYRQASTITMISDWLAYMLSGELAVDPSNAGTTGLLDLTTRDWKPALLDMAGLRADILSPVKETGTLLGVVSSQAAELCGLKAGTPVVVGGGDVQLGCLGLGVVRPAQTAVLGGTFWQQVVNLAAPVTDPEMNVRVNPHVIPGMVQAESISFFTGLTMRWFRDAFCAEEKLIAERLGIDTYTLLEEMASRVPPGSWGVMPIFSDRMRFKTWYHAAPSFINLSIDPDKCNKATLFRALEENAAIVSACNLQQIADFSNIHPSSLVFAGGGSKGKLWSQILADVSGLPVNIPVVKEATALGCAIAAGVGAGIFSSMAETGERLVRWERTHTPDPEKHELYQDSRDKWQAVYQDQLGLVDHGLTTSLWKAPGL
ncbi:autoinducer-2 kinase [Escherichia coli]